MFLLLCKLVVGAADAEEVNEDLFEEEEAEKHDVSLVVLLHIVLVQKCRRHKDMIVVIFINTGSGKIRRHNRKVDGAILDIVLDLVVFTANERLQVDSVTQDGVQDETESVADPENSSCFLDDVTRL